MSATPFSIGVEEEFFLVDADSRALRPRAEAVHAAATRRLGDEVQMELNLAQIETGTPVCATLDEIRAHLLRLRGEVAAAAAASGTHLVPVGTHPFSDWMGQQITPKERYEILEHDYQLLAWEQLVSGCHVHVGIDDPELVIAAMDRVRVWLPTLRALGTNSPFWNGIDTGYASYRMQVFDRWHTSGIAPVLGSRAVYDDVVDALTTVGTVPEASRIYWDARPSNRYPTIELRVADVCLTVDEAVVVAGLGRSLVRTAVAEAQAGQPVDSRTTRCCGRPGGTHRGTAAATRSSTSSTGGRCRRPTRSAGCCPTAAPTWPSTASGTGSPPALGASCATGRARAASGGCSTKRGTWWPSSTPP